MFYAYLLRCRDGSYYCGQTDHLELRYGQHQQGVACAYTKHRRPVTLVWSEAFPLRLEALEAERRTKGWSRAKKEALARGDWQLLSELSRSRQSGGRPSTSSGRTAFDDARTTQSVRAELVEAHPDVTVSDFGDDVR